MSLLSLAQKKIKKSAAAKKGAKKTNDEDAPLDETSNDPIAIAAVVDRNILRNMVGSVHAACIDAVVIEGKTMRQTMIDDRTHLLATGRSRMNTDYIPLLKRKYLAALNGEYVSAAAVALPSIPEALAEAIRKAGTRQKRDRKREGVIHWLWQAGQRCSDDSVNALIDLCVETYVANSAKHAEMTRDVYYHLQRLGHDSSHADALQRGHKVLMSCLRTIYHSENRDDENYDFAVFWTRHGCLAKNFFDQTAVDKVLAETVSWENCSKYVSSLALSCDLGADIFLPFCPEVICNHVNTFMRAEARTLAALPHITSANVATCVGVMVAEAERLKFDRLATSSGFEFDFMGGVVHGGASSSVELARLHVGAAVQTVAVRCGAFTLPTIELDVLDIQVPLPNVKIDADAFSQYVAVRTRMDLLIGKTTFTSPKKLVDFLESKRAVWFAIDPCYALVIANFKNLAGDVGGKRLVAKALATLPDNTGRIPEYSAVIDQLRTFKTTKNWMFSDDTSRGQVTILLEMVSNLQRGEGPPAAAFPKNTPMEAFGKRLAFFCAAVGKKGKDERGRAALDIKLDDLEKQIEAAVVEDATLGTTCDKFKWLLDAQGRKDLKQLLVEADAVMQKNDKDDGGGGAAASSGSLATMVAVHGSWKKAAAEKLSAPKASVASKKVKKAASAK
jgi:hypothetical protein